jgi:hypothetical protein
VNGRTDYSDIQPLERIIPLADNWQSLCAPQAREEVAP